MNNTSYDVIIIGAGFAGLACAQVLARRGVRTMVLEKKSWPGTKIHTTGIVVKELAETWNIPSRFCKKIDRVRLYSPNMDYLDLHSPEYYFLATDTRSLIRWHADQAIQSGASIQYGRSYRTSRNPGGFHILDQNGLQCRYLIGCDGSRSRVASQCQLGRNKQFLFGVEADFKPITGLSDAHLHVFLDKDLARGYIAWMVPGNHSVRIGLAARSPVIPALDRFLEKLSRHWPIDKTGKLVTRSGLIPCGGLVRPFYSESVLLLGDAAGMVSPLTAGGIHPAIQIGNLAGELVADHLLHQGRSPGRELVPLLPRYLYKHGLRFLYDHLPLDNRMYNVLINMPFFRLIAQTLFFHHRGLFSTEAWRDIIRLSLET